MHTYYFLFTLLTFCSVAVSAGLQEVLNVAKCKADIHQEVPNTCVFIMKAEGEEQGKNKFEFFPRTFYNFLEKNSHILRNPSLQDYLEIHFLEIIWYC